MRKLTLPEHPVDALKSYLDLSPEWEEKLRSICDEVVVVEEEHDDFDDQFDEERRDED